MRVPDDYKQWLTTMYCQFGKKWANMHVGPMWSVIPVRQGTSTCTATRNPMDVSVRLMEFTTWLYNIVALTLLIFQPRVPSLRTLWRYIADNPVTTTSSIQVWYNMALQHGFTTLLLFQARVPSSRTLWRYIADNPVTTTSSIQVWFAHKSCRSYKHQYNACCVHYKDACVYSLRNGNRIHLAYM